MCCAVAVAAAVVAAVAYICFVSYVYVNVRMYVTPPDII
jgi:hypothetical protein